MLRRLERRVRAYHRLVDLDMCPFCSDDLATARRLKGYHWHAWDLSLLQEAMACTGAVVEYLEGRLSIHDNSRIGVMTNDPHYLWHLLNLNGYAAYPTARNQAPWGLDAVETAVGPVPSLHPGHGLNTRGLPGGTTPQDRFVTVSYTHLRAHET